jgi:arabinoxylan arabinofuranohydrolase
MKKLFISLFSFILLISSSAIYAMTTPVKSLKVAANQVDTTLKLRLSFDNVASGATTVSDANGNGYVATLQNGATVSASGGIGGVLDLGTSNGYLDLGAQLGSGLISKLQNFTISTYIYIANDAVTTSGNFVFAFGNSADIGTAKNGTMFFSAMNTRYAICTTDWHTEQTTPAGSVFAKGSWKHLAITYTAGTTKIYIDGVLFNTSTTISINPKTLGSTAYNFIGRSSYSADAYLAKTLVDEFRIYNRVLPDTSIVRLASSLPDYQTALTKKADIDALSTISLVDGQKIISNITLPTLINGVSISWSSSDESTISTTGIVVRPANGSVLKNVTLTATAVSGGVTVVKTFNLVVLPSYTNSDIVKMDADSLTLLGTIDNLRSSLILPITGIQGSSIVWSSNTPSLIANNGKLIYLPEKGTGKTHVVLTAAISIGDVTQTKAFDVYVAEKEGYSAYLFVYFTGTSEAIRFALSNDGMNYRALNGNNQVLNSASISLTGGVRDPHIMRAEDGKTFYMVATDMVANNGWDSNRGIVLLKSTDLVNWTSTAINISTTYPEFANLTRAWAPQTIYDKKAGKYMVYLSIKTSAANDVDKVFYAYANADFTALESAPKLLFQNPAGTATIDADIIEKDSLFYLFSKTEGAGDGIKKAVSTSLTGPYTLLNKYLDRSSLPVEGGCVYRLIDTNDYILMYDVYQNQKYQFTKSSDLTNFTVIDSLSSMNFAPRHGTSMTITKAEAERLALKWGNATDLYINASASDSVKKINSKFDQTAKTIYLAVKKGTDISNFDPQLVAPAGCVISPSSSQDFSKGAVSYTVSISGIGSKTYAVTVQVSGNPVLEGYYADPEILYSKKTKKFYIYPTSDGFVNWAGTYFKSFSSTDLVHWTDEGVILDLPTQVSWGKTNAWAPCIEEKMVNGAYKYFYYFTDAQKIGVAVSDNPTGPFVDSGAALISSSPTGSGQQIDPDVFTDSISGKSYLYYGNSYMAVAELNDNMTTLKSGTTKVITPSGDTFTEGSYVIKRNNTYYFFWSNGDTRKVDYCVYYGMSTSPTGPITIPANNHILVQNPSLGIYGTGHNSVIQIPGKDEWYMVYHRFTRPRGITMAGDSAGYFREVCIDKLEFNADGTIKPIVPTIEGIQPVSLQNGGNTAVLEVNSDQPKGNVISIELYSINGIAVNYRNCTLEKGVYLLKKKYDSGAITFNKIIVSNTESQIFFFK